jgi:hypothetical protein
MVRPPVVMGPPAALLWLSLHRQLGLGQTPVILQRQNPNLHELG